MAGIVNQAVLLDTLEDCVEFVANVIHRNVTLSLAASRQSVYVFDFNVVLPSIIPFLKHKMPKL